MARGTMIDTHCHIDQYPDPLAEVRALDGSAVAVIAVTSSPRNFEALYRRFGKERRIRIALGVHPLRAATLREADWRIFERGLTKTSYVGEVGLDFSPEGRETRETQERAFKRVLKSIAEHRRLLTVHSRGAEKRVLDLLADAKVGPSIFHWYSGPFGLLDALLDAGHYCSFNPAMIRSKRGREIIRRVPKDRVLTETDGPFVKVGRRGAIPGDVRLVYEHLSELWQEPVEAVIKSVYQSFLSLFSEREQKQGNRRTIVLDC